MPDIIRITIKSTSRTCRDRLTLRPDRILYTCRPTAENGDCTVRIWTYTSSAPAFRRLFREAAAAVLGILERDDLPYLTGPGVISLRIDFADRTRLKWNYAPSCVSFRECFDAVKRMIPPCEEEPAVFSLADTEGGAAP